MSSQSMKPLPTPLAMSTAPFQPTPSPLPIRPRPTSPSPSTSPKPEASRPHPKPTFPTIKLRLKVLDLNHPAANRFFSNCNPSTALSSAVDSVLSTLYKPTRTNAHILPTRSVSLILRSMSGVAYTTGSSLDDDHKEIHFSLEYINQIPSHPSNRQRDEIQGVLVHEMVHCWQWNAIGTAPGGLIEGIADFVRLKAGLDPPHWKKECDGDWDAGYQHTGYFLEWLEGSYGEGTVRKINEGLRERTYVENEFWKDLFGKNVCDLWEEYSKTFDEKDRDVATHDEREIQKEEEDEGIVLVESHNAEQ